LTMGDVINKVAFSSVVEPRKKELFLGGETVKPVKKSIYSIENKEIYSGNKGGN